MIFQYILLQQDGANIIDNASGLNSLLMLKGSVRSLPENNIILNFYIFWVVYFLRWWAGSWLPTYKSFIGENCKRLYSNYMCNCWLMIFFVSEILKYFRQEQDTFNEIALGWGKNVSKDSIWIISWLLLKSTMNEKIELSKCPVFYS